MEKISNACPKKQSLLDVFFTVRNTNYRETFFFHM